MKFAAVIPDCGCSRTVDNGAFFRDVVLLNRSGLGHHLLELAAGFGLIGVLAYVLESRAGTVHPQDWEFYVTVLCLYLIFAFPAFVWRYFWQGKHRQ